MFALVMTHELSPNHGSPNYVTMAWLENSESVYERNIAKRVTDVRLKLSDLTESVIPKWMFETGAVYLHGYDKEGNKLCM